MNKFGRTVSIIFLSISLLIGSLAIAWSDDQFPETSIDGMIYVRGLISKVYLDKNQISVRPPKGKLIRITIESDSELEGVSQIDQFKKEQQVKIWYSPDSNGNKAIRIIKLMELGC